MDRCKLDLRLGDCMDAMRVMKDNAFDLAIVDPPYGIERAFKSTSRIAKYGQVESVNDYEPNKDYFDELFRVSVNVICWGYNHLANMLPPTKEFIFWYKHQPVDTYSDGELAYTSFNKTAKCFDYPFFGSKGADDQRIHPTQKPVKLYEWVLHNYAKQGDKILDTHLGSGSIAIACWNKGFDLTGFEIDEVYFNTMNKRVEHHKRQLQMF